MKTAFRLGSFVVALAVVIGAGHLWAESKEKKAPPRTRIGLLNITYVIKNYDKYKQFQEEIKEVVAPFQKRDAELRAQLEKLRTEAEKSSILQTKGEGSGKNSRKDELEEKAKKIQRRLEDNSQKAKKSLGKRSDDEMKLLFLDVYEAVQHYAVAHDLDLVMHYNDAVTKEDFLGAPTIAQAEYRRAYAPLHSGGHGSEQGNRGDFEPERAKGLTVPPSSAASLPARRPYPGGLRAGKTFIYASLSRLHELADRLFLRRRQFHRLLLVEFLQMRQQFLLLMQREEIVYSGDLECRIFLLQGAVDAEESQ